MELADWAVAVTPEGTEGAVVSAGGGGGGGGAGGGLGAAPPSPPPPHADNKTPSDANVASPRFRVMPIFLLVLRLTAPSIWRRLCSGAARSREVATRTNWFRHAA